MGIPHKVLYLVLNPFVYPLCWALLTGQAMFPAKHIVDRAIEDFIDNRKYTVVRKVANCPLDCFKNGELLPTAESTHNGIKLILKLQRICHMD